LTVSANSDLRGLLSCRSRSWDSPFRAFPFQKAVLLSKPVAPLRLDTHLSSRSCLPTMPFPASHLDRSPAAAHEAGPPREGPLRLAVPRRFSAGERSLARFLIHPRLVPAPVSPLGSRALTIEVEEWHGTERFPGSSPECYAPPLRSVSPSESPFSSSRVSSHRSTVDALLGFSPSRAFALPALGLGTSPAVARHRAPRCSVAAAGPPSSLVLHEPRGKPNVSLDLRVSGVRKIGLSLSGLPALLGFPTSSVSHANLVSTRPSIIDSRQGRRRVTASPAPFFGSLPPPTNV
jgi:hypothetical protein